MSEPVFLTLAEVWKSIGIRSSGNGGRDSLRDIGLLESALAMPQFGSGGAYFHSTLFEMAAAYAFHIAENSSVRGWQ